ncbi:MAG: glycosyltransferase family 4 protein [Planctomycetota bacterium]
MKVIVCHNFYAFPGGEDQVYRDETWLLEQHGHEVIRFEKRNAEIDRMNKFDVARSTIWNPQTHNELTSLVEKVQPNLIHFHNTFPLISSSGLSAAKLRSVPVVQTLHNFRAICPGATLYRKSKICDRCIGKKFPWPSVMHGCYRKSRLMSGILSMGNAANFLRGTWRKDVDQFIALTRHSRDIFIRGGIDENKISVKPNFVQSDPGLKKSDGKGAIFVGRLSPEKGLDVLLEAWMQHNPNTELTIVGDGPLRDKVNSASISCSQISYRGQLPFGEVLQKIRESSMLIMPSVWFETFGRTTIEAFATGTPVIASKLGAMQELVTHGVTGLHFEPGCAKDLVDKVHLLASSDELRKKIGDRARIEYEKKYSPEKNYDLLMSIYERAIRGQ